MTTLSDLKSKALAATPGPWRPEREPPPVGNIWFDAHCADGATPVESTGTHFALGVAVAAASRREDADFIAACSPDVVLALIERVERAEALLLRSREEVVSPGTDIDEDIHNYLLSVGLPSQEWIPPHLKGDGR